MRCCRRVILGWSVLTVLAASPAARAQQSTPTYAVHRAIKVEPVRSADFEKFFRDTIKKYHAARKSAGVELGWSLAKVVLPLGSEAPYQYVSTTFYNRFPPLDPEPRENAPFIEKAGTTPEKFITALRDVGTLVRTNISVNLAMLGTIEPGDFMRVDYMKVAPGKSSDYITHERTVYQALHEQRIKEGIISSWSLNAMVFPGGSQREYDFYTVNAVKQSERFGGGNTGYGSAFFAKVHPNLNYFSVMNRTPELRTIVNTRYLRVMEALR